MNILIVEDDEKVGKFLKDNLAREHYEVQLITTYQELQENMQNPEVIPSLIVLDRLLGNEDSRKLIKGLKQKFSSTAILILSALNSPSEKATLLDEGADDYLGKPFSLVELQARVRALIRRSASDPTQSTTGFYLHLENTLIDLKTRNVLCNGKKIDLTPKEFALFANFCEHKNRVFSKFQLLDIIWETNLNIESNVIEVNIMNLRKKLEVCGSSVKIQSKRNVGYWLET